MCIYVVVFFFLLFLGGLRAPHICHVYAVRIVSTGHKRGKMYALAHTHGVLMFLYIHTTRTDGVTTRECVWMCECHTRVGWFVTPTTTTASSGIHIIIQKL